MAVISVRVNMLAAHLPCPRQTLGEKTFKLNQQIARGIYRFQPKGRGIKSILKFVVTQEANRFYNSTSKGMVELPYRSAGTHEKPYSYRCALL
jgi:hypothetical protein